MAFPSAVHSIHSDHYSNNTWVSWVHPWRAQTCSNNALLHLATCW